MLDYSCTSSKTEGRFINVHLMLLVLVLTRASNAKIQVPLISFPAAHDDDEEDDEEDEDEDEDEDDDDEEEEDDGRVEAVDVAELEKVKPLNLQSSFPASTNESNRSDFI